jgi:hypothetical protein
MNERLSENFDRFGARYWHAAKRGSFPCVYVGIDGKLHDFRSNESAWIASGQALPPADETNPEDATIDLERMLAMSHVHVPIGTPVLASAYKICAADIHSVQVDQSVGRREFDVTMHGDNSNTYFVPGPIDTTITFTTTDPTLRPGQRIQVDLFGIKYEAIIGQIHRSVDGLEKVIAHGVPPNERSHKETGMAPKNAKRPRFYVGSKKAVQPDFRGETWAKFTEAEAIAHATKLVESTGEEQFIVKVIKVVRRKPQPIVVEVVK